MRHYVITTLDGAEHHVTTAGDPTNTPHLLGRVADIEVIDGTHRRSLIPTSL